MRIIKQDYRNLDKIQKDEFHALIQKVYDSDPDNFFLVKVGANDGWMCDNLYDFVIKNDPKSLMIEPIPCYFDALKTTFEDLKNVNFERVAIDSTTGVREITYIEEEKFASGEVDFRLSHAPELIKEHWARGLGSFYKDKNNLGCPELQKHTTTIKVETTTPSDILEKYGVNENTNLVYATDCEGHDYELLKVFDFDKYKPKMYICEIVLLTRYPLSHPRRQEYINAEKNPDARKPPPSYDNGWEVEIKMTPSQQEYLADKDFDTISKTVSAWVNAGTMQTPEWVYKRGDGPQNKEYLQENGLYTVEEFRSAIEIFNKNGYVVRDQSYDGDIIAISNQLVTGSLGE